MANIKASIVDIRKSRKHAEANRKERSRLKSLKKKCFSALEVKADDAAEASSTLASALDKAAKRNVIHPNKASRLKSRAAKRLQAIARAC